MRLARAAKNRFLALAVALLVLGMVAAAMAAIVSADAPPAPYRAVLPAVARDSGALATPGDVGAVGETFTVQPPKLTAISWLDDLRADGNIQDPEQGLVDWARESSDPGGAAGEVFRRMDGARSLGAQRLIGQAKEHTRTTTFPATLARRPSAPRHAQPLASFSQLAVGGSLGLLAMGTDLFTAHGDLASAAGSAKPVTMSADEKGVHMEIAMRPKLSGSKLEAEVEISLSAEKDGVAYGEKNKGTLRLDVCPDAEGNVPVEVDFKGGVSSGPNGAQWSFHARITGHVDDDANLVGADFDHKGEMSSQPATRRNKYAEWTTRYTVRGIHDKTYSVDPNSVTQEIGRQAIHAGTQAESDLWYGSAVKFGMTVGAFVGYLALTEAEKLWQGGSCVEVLAPTPNAVDLNSETPFTAKVRQKIEGVELQAPVVATLTSGELSVAPTGTKIPAPAGFVYRAPDRPGDATVTLETRSRRGVGALEVAFTTGRAADYLLDFETTITSDHGIDLNCPAVGMCDYLFTMHLRAHGVPVPFSTDAFPVSAPLRLLEFKTGVPTNCSVSYNVHPTNPFRILSGKLDWTTRDGREEVSGVELVIDTGDIGGSYALSCPGSSGTFSLDDDPNVGWLSGNFLRLHFNDVVNIVDPSRFGFRIASWDMAQGSALAQKTFTQHIADLTETTTLTLRRAP